jgi:hypothetical protein
MTYPAHQVTVLPALDDEVPDGALADIRRAVDGILGRSEQYERAREYDSIDLIDELDDTQLGQSLRQVDVDLEPNYCAPIISAVADGLVIDSITATRQPDAVDGDGLPVEDVEATRLVNDIWDAQLLGLFYPTWQRDSLRDGDGYLMAWIAESRDDTPTPEPGQLEPDQLNVTYVDPTRGQVFYSEENPRVKDFFAMLWTVDVDQDKHTSEVQWRLNLIYPDRIERYVTPPRRSDGSKPKAADFRPYVGDDDEPEEFELPNPTNQVFVYHLRTDVTYGKPIHVNAYAPQDAIAEIVDEMRTTFKFQAWPQAYAIQEAENMAQKSIREDPLADEYDDGLDDFDDEPDRDSTNDGHSGTGSDLTFTPGGIALLKGFKTVGQLSAADPNVFLDPWRELAKTAADTTGTPPWTFRSIGSEIPSGVALKIASAAQTARRRRMATLFGTEMQELLAFCAELCGMPDVQVRIAWAPFEPVDETERWTLVKLRTDAGVPLKQALMMAGIPERQAVEWAEEAELQKEQEFERQQALKTPAPGDPAPDDE